ncbi:bifunctional (p)ppGpp synthetase/guanosine-3',5'-bis(diphosphate) 3'-pyrophosphohydrolase [Neisseria sp. N95_16]|uniref:GTP pyrophosphokinase n=1 Tax=Neisseria brasiliensis TaxID=2666100 RepID=A0A5Q3RWG6_9NEIS|nr:MULTISPECIES: bifunctional (p)ppGpp synthetase/guanosine-3',5'-bis(diphosphate) 3'-pyrophosphohydrolase [Neisseria]MRN37641.1 RelA/SpoT family protein [Neisseria brasiliensis]PJO10312.1 bifunctional (p)ppGpp synthetase/guanosine-3',5'-bis(diphosphate) 3'-pyrophosphohydrolase [Neisseria sp. N95_16]PJO78169.1 bifunctional (p)ppGpp synthetase/guanosine-3',5'-bis(diphosphate) 3'-pyrophosphohydrolase [Neisseria sp. N177_16]QGL24610.1 RelA/SpoT family protein [Neisseria brasiliensis]
MNGISTTSNIAPNLEQYRSWFAPYLAKQSERDAKMLQTALNLAEQYYPHDALTVSGEPVLGNLMGAAKMVNEMDLLADAVAATILADISSYCDHWQETVTEQCNATVCELIKGIDEVQKLTQFAKVDSLATPEERAQQAETMRKMLLAMVTDIRVVLIKLAMRTRTMQYIGSQEDSPEKRELAKETLDIFAPLANRLGVWQLKWQLEDLGFRHQEPEKYREIAQLLDEKRTERLEYIENFLNILSGELTKYNVHFEVAGRPKHIYSIYKKMVKKKLSFDGLYDIRAVRILVDTVPECYTTLGIVHSLWQPIPGEFDDYIANPKGNGYKSLHTVIVGPEDKGVEVQIRTFDMHQFNEFGVAAHWRYKEGGKGDSAYEQKIAWLRQLLDWRENMAESGKEDLASAFKTELFQDTIYVMTPHGKVLSLPAGATPIDFAYALHSSIGDRCRGAKVDGQIVPLSTALENGQRVEIITAKEGNPSVNWLYEGWVKSSKAISKIRSFIRQQNADAIKEDGRAQLDKQLVKINPKPNLQDLSEKLGFKKLDDLYTAIGQGEISPRAIQKACGTLNEPPPVPVDETTIVKQSKIKKGGKNGVLIDGEDGLLTTLAKCCKPAPPDDIIGFVTRERGISVHRKTCPSFQHLAEQSPDKVLNASWAALQEGQVFAVDVEIRAQDRNGLLRDVSDALARHKLNVTAVQTQSRDLEASMRFTLEVRQVNDLPRVLASLTDVKGVLSVTRL